MLLAEPTRTPFDLNFSVLGFPVRVHPFFWLVGAILGFSGGGADGLWIITCLLATFVSILIHELGHALMIRRFGREAYIVLYGMGGLAIEGRPKSNDPFGNPWSLDSYTPSYGGSRPRSSNEQILISAAGPGIQFVLAGALIGLIYGLGGWVDVDQRGFLPVPNPHLGGSLANNANLHALFYVMLQINIFWALMNLLPVLPLDGGQIALQVLTQQDPWGGTVRALWLSVITGAIAAAAGGILMQNMLMLFLFGSLAVSSFLSIQQLGGGGRRPW